MIGKGVGEKGAVWVAVRIPDDCISAHANQSRIRQFPLKDKENCIYSKDVISFAREKDYFNGKDEDFSFQAAYAPTDFGAQRFCEARVWSFFNRWAAEDMKPYLGYAMGESGAAPMPLYVKPKQPLSVQDVKEMMRDHYEGTPLDVLNDPGMGPWEMPYRPTRDVGGGAIRLGGRKTIFQRTSHQHPTDQLLLCIADAFLAARPHWWRNMVWQ